MLANFSAITCFVTAFGLTPGGEEPALQRFTFAEPHMGTQFQIVLYAHDKASANRAAQAAFARIGELDGIMSDYRPTSELMQLCKKAGGKPVPVSAYLFFVLSRSQQLARQTDGAFDVTIGHLTRLWRLSRRTQELPRSEKLAKAKGLAGWEKVKLDAKRRTVQLAKPGMRLDLGGIAKGYASDQALAVLKKHGISRALVAAGGDIAVGAAPPNAKGWRIGIRPLEASVTKAQRQLLLTNAAVSTSGDTEQFVVIDGKRYSHILDPRTGLGLRGRMSVTVVAPNATMSDSLATAVSVLGIKKGLALIAKTPDAAVLVVRKTDQGEEIVHESKQFKQLLVGE